MIKISVIVPVYNNEKFLEKCLNSLCNQTLNDIEIICINDGSKDKSLEILKKFNQKDKRIKIISQKNQGPSIARNNGIEISSGEYIGFVDSDDWIDLNYYEKLYTAAKKYNADIAVCGIKRLRSYKWKYHLKITKAEITEDTNEKFEICDVPEKCYVFNKIYKREELIKNNIYFEPYVFYEDRCFTTEALIHLKKLVTVPDIYYNYWTNNNSIVKTKSPKKFKDSEYTHEKMMNIIKANNVNLDHYRTKIKKFKIFGLTIYKIKYYKLKKEYIIFNHIKFSINK